MFPDNIEFSTKTTNESYNIVKYEAKKNKWIIIDEKFPLILFTTPEKDNDILWDAEDCILGIVFYSKERENYVVKFRKILATTALNKIFIQPRGHLPISVSKFIGTFFLKEKPTFDIVLKYWKSMLVEKNK